LPNSSSANKIISVLNRKFKKLVKAFTHTNFLETLSNRRLFTNHDLHQNKLGKNLVNLQLAQFLNIFGQKALHPISLGWYEAYNDVYLSCDVNQIKSLNRSSVQTKKKACNQA
jgi:hypothetical protein